MTATKTLPDKPYEFQMQDRPRLQAAATAAANEICGFSLAYEPR